MSQHSFRQIKDWPQLRFASSPELISARTPLISLKTLVRIVLVHFIERVLA